MLTGFEVSQAFLQYLKVFEQQLENREAAAPANPLDAEDSMLSRLVAALQLSELERLALMWGPALAPLAPKHSTFHPVASVCGQAIQRTHQSH